MESTANWSQNALVGKEKENSVDTPVAETPALKKNGFSVIPMPDNPPSITGKQNRDLQRKEPSYQTLLLAAAITKNKWFGGSLRFIELAKE